MQRTAAPAPLVAAATSGAQQARRLAPLQGVPRLLATAPPELRAELASGLPTPTGALAAAAGAAAGVAAGAARPPRRRRPCAAGPGRPRRVTRLGGLTATLAAPTVGDLEAPELDEDDTSNGKVSPFSGSEDGEGGKPRLPLTWENVQLVLDELRPYLQGDGGDCKIVDIDGAVVKLELQGACSSCSSSSVTLKMGIEKSLKERIPEVDEVVSVMPEEEQLSEDGVEEVLDGIRPFLSVSGGTIDVHSDSVLEGDAPAIVLRMTGPPLKSMAVRVEVVNRIKRKYPKIKDVKIVGEDGEGSM
ncbi:unnamed protein product [Prorocentrum cordatum]|uniref:NIF system FeS cluster assembly NifU C-terminal domain-containing protein n=1 Tax=Prorocentrum cordatum TaxID=2364126 RepID=A0ABN9QQM1_9DINO|nr:unnamed protein product [Polarella glacialis]